MISHAQCVRIIKRHYAIISFTRVTALAKLRENNILVNITRLTVLNESGGENIEG